MTSRDDVQIFESLPVRISHAPAPKAGIKAMNAVVAAVLKDAPPGHWALAPDLDSLQAAALTYRISHGTCVTLPSHLYEARTVNGGCYIRLRIKKD